jgi:hypothetical protein
MGEQLTKAIKDAVDAATAEMHREIAETQSKVLENMENIDALKKQFQIYNDFQLAKKVEVQENEAGTSRNVRQRTQPPCM